MLRGHFNSWIILFTFLFFTFHHSNAQKIDDLIEVSLVSEVETIKSGDSAWLLLQIDMKPSWHAYWKTAGQTGFPTTIDWDYPQGVELEETLFPAPILYQFQDFISYVHADTFYLLTHLKVKPGAVFEKEIISLTAQLSTLVCDEGNCIPFNKELIFEIPVSQETVISKVNSKKVQNALAELPKPLPTGTKFSAVIKEESIVLSFDESSLKDFDLKGFNFFPDGDFFSHGEKQQFKKNDEGRISVQLSIDSLPEVFSSTIKGC